jgi:RNA polymerase I-specific transcription initiation factor RRN3
MDESSAPPSPSKRVRVTFNNDVRVCTADESWEKSQAVVREEVRRALLRHVQGDSEAYDRIKHVFGADPTDEDRPTKRSLKNHLLALVGNISLLDRAVGGLVNEVIESDWVGRDEAYVKLFVHFLGNLISAHGGWCSNVMSMLVGILCDGKIKISNLAIFLTAHAVSKDAGRLPDYPVVRKSEMFDRAHMAIRYILQAVPSSLQILPDIISKTFPTEHWTTNAPVVYTRNILRLLEYVPQIQSDVLTLITTQLVKIDVHVQVDIEDLDDDMSESIVQEISKRNDDDYDSGSESEVDDDDLPPTELRLKTVKTNIIRMDMIIDILFEYYSPVFSSSESSTSKDLALDLLLSQFHNIILPTQRSRHTQFLLFHYAQTSTLLIDRFASTCINIISNKRQPQLLRQSAAAYLGSFIARGAHVPSHVVRDVFVLLAQELNALRIQDEPTCRGPDLRRYAIFYSIAQALIYIFCFRWRDLSSNSTDDNASDSEAEEGEEDQEVLFSHTIKDPLRSAIYSKLNPLKICSPAIVAEFARIAHHLHFLYVYPLLESNKRLRLASVRSLTALAEQAEKQKMKFHLPSHVSSADTAFGGEESKWQLEAFFPFDPYHLPRSKRWVEGDYKDWKGLDGDDEDDSDEEDEEDEDEDESEAEEIEEGVAMDVVNGPSSIVV